MNWLKILMLLPLIIQLIVKVEAEVQGVKMGEVKKGFVMDFVGILLKAAVGFGVIKSEEVGAVLDVFSELVDSTVEILNGLGVFKSGG